MHLCTDIILIVSTLDGISILMNSSSLCDVRRIMLAKGVIIVKFLSILFNTCKIYMANILRKLR